MNSILKLKYHIDKLVLIYKIPDSFFNGIKSEDYLFHSFYESNVFIFTLKTYATKYVVPRYVVEYKDADNNTIKIGEFKPDIYEAFTLEVDNQFLYSGQMNLLYEFEQIFHLELIKIAQIDVACDANQNLPRKLNDVLHKPNCQIVRKGAKLPTTEKGNQIIGTKVTQNIKTLTSKEQPNQSYYFELKSSGSRRPIIYRAYNKGREIVEKSHKDYIRESNGFGDSIYRIEVSVNSYELVKQSRKKDGWQMDLIYQNLSNQDFLREFFILYLNRIGTLIIDNRRYRISEILRLE